MDLDYFIGLGNSIKEHPDVVVAQSNPQTGMVRFSTSGEMHANKSLVERQLFLFAQLD